MRLASAYSPIHVELTRISSVTMRKNEVDASQRLAEHTELCTARKRSSYAVNARQDRPKDSRWRRQHR